MDSIKELVRGQQAVLDDGKIITILEYGKNRENIVHLNDKDKKNVINICRITKLLPCKVLSKEKARRKFNHPELFDTNTCTRRG